MEIPDKKNSHAPGRMVQGSKKAHHVTQNGRGVKRSCNLKIAYF